jgi:hypothetical protein
MKSPEVRALDQAQAELADVTRRLAALEYPEARSHVMREPVRTSFDAVFPGMPPALRLSA